MIGRWGDRETRRKNEFSTSPGLAVSPCLRVTLSLFPREGVKDHTAGHTQEAEGGLGGESYTIHFTISNNCWSHR
jgi:hypothetical protein